MVHSFILSFMAFFAIMNPISGLPVFLSLTQDDDDETTRLVALKALIAAFIIIVVFSFAGKYIFEVFGITLYALRIAGGFIVAGIGYQMLQGSNNTKVKTMSPADKNEARRAQLGIAISPLATPLLAGPGTITTAMTLSAHSDLTNMIICIVAFGILCIITYFLNIYGKAIVRYLGRNALDGLTKIMGLILAVIGAQMAIQGLLTAFPVLSMH